MLQALGYSIYILLSSPRFGAIPPSWDQLDAARKVTSVSLRQSDVLGRRIFRAISPTILSHRIWCSGRAHVAIISRRARELEAIRLDLFATKIVKQLVKKGYGPSTRD